MQIPKRKINQTQFISQVVILSVIFGLAGGVVGQILTDVYLSPYSLFTNISVTNTNQNRPVVPELQRVKRFLGIEQDFEVEKSVRQVMPTLAGIYIKKSTAGAEVLNQLYLPKDLLGNAFVLTSDGWLVTYNSVIVSKELRNLVVIYDNKEFLVDEFIVDQMTKVVFVKISANNLPVVVLGDSDENTAGQLALTVNALNEVVVTNIKKTAYQVSDKPSDFILSTEQYSRLILLEDALTTVYVGSPLINLAGEVTGIIKEIDPESGRVTVVPINQFRPVILGVLRDGLIKRPYLGVTYLDLSKSPGLGIDYGALIYKKPLPNTPAADAGLQVDDIIIGIDGRLIDGDEDLTSLIQQYQPGTELNLDIVRDGKRVTKKVTLSLLP